MKYLIYIFLLITLTACLPEPEAKPNEWRDENFPEIPSIKVGDEENNPVFYMGQAIEDAKALYKTQNIVIRSIQVADQSKNKSGYAGWIVTNDDSKQCTPALPSIITYGMALPSCMDIIANNKFDKTHEYMIIVDGYENGKFFEFYVKNIKSE
ncbi:hypothetical protein [Aquitalea sp.]|jgi:hypothetical protein|uniref:hypothetical protein n=1 Tax=Aquitalea sp. TaxID=1872623 RepID=UPI00258A4E4A|nr:hypothetical protein [Aquitalea sp.]